SVVRSERWTRSWIVSSVSVIVMATPLHCSGRGSRTRPGRTGAIARCTCTRRWRDCAWVRLDQECSARHAVLMAWRYRLQLPVSMAISLRVRGRAEDPPYLVYAVGGVLWCGVGGVLAAIGRVKPQ